MSGNQYSTNRYSCQRYSCSGSPKQNKLQQRRRQVTDVMSPETIVDEPPPQPDYPRYRARPGERIVLADVDPDTSEHYKKKKHVEEELEYQRSALEITRTPVWRTSAAC